MTVINGQTLLRMAPIKDMAREKYRDHGVSYGLSEAGYDIRIKQEIRFVKHHEGFMIFTDGALLATDNVSDRFCLASSIEEFQIPGNLVGIVHDKSTWARQGLSVFNTVVEPKWNGKLTLELVYHGSQDLIIPAGAGIAQVVFSMLSDPGDYGDGKYQNQEDGPVGARFA
jgi:dCTP deaminase